MKQIKFGRDITPRYQPSKPREEVSLKESLKETGRLMKAGFLDRTVWGGLVSIYDEIQYNNMDEEDYNPYVDPQIPDRLKFLVPKLLHTSGSREETKLKLAEWQQEQEDKRNTMFQISSFFSEIFLDPVQLALFTPGVRGLLLGKNALNRTIKGIYAEETFKQVTDEDRSLMDAAVVFGAGMVINRVGNRFRKYDEFDVRGEGSTKQKLDEWDKASKTETPHSTRGNVAEKRPKQGPPTYEQAVKKAVRENRKTVLQNAEPKTAIDKLKFVRAKLLQEYSGLKFIITTKKISEVSTKLIKQGKDRFIFKNYGVKFDRLTNTVEVNLAQLKAGFASAKKAHGIKSMDEYMEFHIRRLIERKKNSKFKVSNSEITQMVKQAMRDSNEFVKKDSVIISDIEKQTQAKVNQQQFKNRLDPEVKDSDLGYTPTKLGLENLGLSALDFIFNGPSRKAKEFLLNLTKSDIFHKFEDYAAAPDSVEIIMNTLYKPHLVSVIENLENAFIRYVKEASGKDIKYFKKAQLMFSRTKRLPNGETLLSYNDFQTAVYKAVRNKKVMMSGDSMAKKYISQAANTTSDYFKFYEKEIIDTKLFLIELLKREDWLRNSIARFETAGKKKPVIKDPKTGKKWTKAELDEALEATMKEIKDKSKLIDGYVPQLYKRTNIERNFTKFKEILSRRVLAGMDPKEADEILDSFKQYNPFRRTYENYKEAEGVYRMKTSPTSKFLKQRLLQIDDATLDELIQFDFIETNIETLSSFYYRSITPDIVMTKKYGDPGGYGWFGDIDELGYAPGLDQVARELTEMVAKGKIDGKDMKEIMDRLEKLRDLRKGIYGLSDNPHSFMSTTIRNWKLFNTLTQLTGASALADLGRLVTIGGLEQNFGRIFQSFQKGIAGAYQQGKNVGKKAGQLNDLVLQFSRAQILSGNDIIQSSFVGFESKLQKLGALNFQYGNLQNSFTTITKTFASLWGGDDLLIKIANVVAGKADLNTIRFLNQKGIDKNTAFKIWDQYTKKGYGPGARDWNWDRISVANTDLWDDANTAFSYNRALNDYVDELIITPGDGSAPLIANTEVGSLFFQYKKFSLDMTRKLLIKGMQRKDQKIIGDIAALTAFGMIVDKSRSEDYGKDYEKKTFREKLIDGAERGGVFGIFGDVNRIIESLSDNKIGLKPLLGIGKPYGTSLTSKAGSITPAASTIGTVTQILYDWGRGRHTHHTARRIRKLVPLNNIWYLDGIFDKFEKGIY